MEGEEEEGEEEEEEEGEHTNILNSAGCLIHVFRLSIDTN
jgi:hypothetical protein